MIWFTADFHLSHNNIIKYCNRPFKSVKEMDAMIMGNIEDLVKSSDMLYYLGDLTFSPSVARCFFDRFSDQQIHFIIGNHDTRLTIKIAKEYCISVAYIKDIKIKEQPITLCHYAMRVWNKSHYNAWQLYAHSHGMLPPLGKQYDVGVDNNNFRPISSEELTRRLEKQPDNSNYIHPKLDRQIV